MSLFSAGSVCRREFMAVLGGGALLSRTLFAATAGPFDLTGLESVGIASSNPDKSVRFYARVFGDAVLKDHGGPRSFVKLGPAYIAISPAGEKQPLPGAGQISIGVRNFVASDVQLFLDQAGITHSSEGQGVLVKDPDGIIVRFQAADSWGDLAKQASRISVPVSGDPVVRPTSMNHLLLAVSDPEKSAVFYEKLLGPVAQRTLARPPLSGRIWFQAGKGRVGLAPLNQGLNVSGQRPGVDHFGLIAPFEREALIKALEAAGATILPQGEGPDAAGVDFRDADGVRLQVMPPPAPRA